MQELTFSVWTARLPSFLQHQKHKSSRGPTNKHFWQVWLKSVQRFQRRRFKCEKLTDGRRMLTHDKSSHGLWPGELTKIIKCCQKYAIQFVYNFPFIGPFAEFFFFFYWFHHVFPILSVILTKYHYIILTNYPGIQFHRYIS
jgi:hypothetical protein